MSKFSVRILWILFERPACQTLLVGKVCASKIQHGNLHRTGDSLSPSGSFTLKKRGENACHEVDARAGVADLRARDHRESTDLTGRRSGAAGALRDIFIYFA